MADRDYDRRYADTRRRRSLDEQDYYYTYERVPRDRYHEKVAVDRAEEQWRRIPASQKEMALVVAEDVDAAVRSGDRGEVVRYDRDRHRRPSDDSDSNSEDSRDRRRSRDHTRRRRHSTSRERKRTEDRKGRCWYSHKERKDANVFERNFDSSYDGILAAAAGAALGAMTARRFAGEENSKLKTGGAAVAGALAFNAAENWYRVYVEDEEDFADKVKRKAKEKIRL